MNAITTEHPPLDLEAIRTRQQATWSTGDYGQIGVRLQIVGETLCDAVGIRATDAVLDVAAGNGNATLAAARRFAAVTSTDFVPALLEQGRRRADTERLPVTFQVADVLQLPFADASFDVVLSTFGVMFVPDPERAAAEMLRVVKPGGRIGLATWTPEGFIGQFFKLVASFVPPPAGLRSPLEWGTEGRVARLFCGQDADMRTTRKLCPFVYRSAEHFVEFFRAYYGPMNRAFAALDPSRHAEFTAALIDLLHRWNQSSGDDVLIGGEYLEIVITK